MKLPLLACPSFLLLGVLLSAAVPAQPLAGKGDLLFSDDFERTTLGEWKSVIPAFTVADGTLHATQARADHGAVGRVHRAMRSVIVAFKFMLEGSTTFNAVFDDQAYKGSHAGHICRVAFTPKQVRLGDDKEGVMRNDIFALRKDPTRKAEADALLVGRSAAGPIQLEQKRWHHAEIEIVGDRMRVSVDGQPAAFLQSPGLAHETKSSFHFTVNGPGLRFDEVRIWQAR
ncbi:MAG: hypothetical protein Q8N18_18270 [Opitutaceae bacterium]|nr:hypothetical protein [Opitutaceae bacterium]